MSQNEPSIPGRGPSIFAFSDQDSREAALRNALDRDETEILFQPQVEAQSGRIVGAEALARWKHPQRGEIGARELFAMARSADLLPDLSRKVAARAIELATDWPSHLHLSINVTPEELENPAFDADLEQLLSQTGFAAERLTLEITEDTPIADLPNAASMLKKLRSRGIRIALDDFGTGYCNFGYLKQLPLDAIKLDRSILTGIVESSRDLAVMRSIIALAQALGLKVVAEGIETEAQRKIATDEGCAYLQGFLIAEPSGAKALMEMAGT